MGRERQLSERSMIDIIFVCLVAGFLGAHAMHVLLYERDFSNPLNLLQIWNGISSTGGFLAGGLAAWVFLKIKKMNVYAYGDCLVMGVLVALFFGRLGCFTAHDHPGSLTNFPLAVNFPDGPRHDLGFEEAIILGLFLIVVHTKNIKTQLNQAQGNWMITGMMFYGCIRAALDNMRAEDLANSDARYFGHTPAQYVCAAFVVIATVFLRKQAKHPSNTLP